MKRNRVKSNDIKPEERKFFRYLIRQIDYNDDSNSMLTCNGTIRDHANRFSDKYNIPYKQLMYYLEKWTNIGLYDYGVSLDLGWFCNIRALILGTKFKTYSDIIPNRVKRLYFKNVVLKTMHNLNSDNIKETE